MFRNNSNSNYEVVDQVKSHNGVWNCVVPKHHHCSADFMAEEFQTSTGVNGSLMEWVSMAAEGEHHITKSNAKRGLN